MTEKELISRGLEDEDAFAELVRCYLKHIFNFVRIYVGDSADAEDITQETFVKVWKNLRRYDKSKPFKTWIFAIAKNTVFDYLRKKKISVFSDIDANDEKGDVSREIADTTPLPEELFARKEVNKLITKAFESLLPYDRSILSLRYEEDMTFEEISAVMKKPMNTIKSRHLRALRKLRKLLDAPK